jgi:hypothetical protein
MPLHPREVLVIEDRLAWPSSWVISFPLPHDSLGVGERGFGQVMIQLHQLTGPITPACDRYVQYLLAGATHRSLIDTGGGYSLEGASFSHTTPRPFQPTVSPFHLRAPPDLQLIQNLSIKSELRF